MKKLLPYLLSVFVVCLLSASMPALASEQKSDVYTSDTVIMLHGLGRNAFAMWYLEKKLKDAGFSVHNLDYPSRKLPPDEMLTYISKLIDDCCAKIPSGKANFVGHSLGGLLIRAYLQNNPRIQPARVVLLGTPNNGSELADSFAHTAWFEKILGPTAQMLGTEEDSFPHSLKAPYYELGVIAGNKSINPLGSWIIPGADDGMVSIESTQLDGMSDFIILPTDHVLMRYDSEVSEQTVHFLKTGQFKHAANESVNH